MADTPTSSRTNFEKRPFIPKRVLHFEKALASAYVLNYMSYDKMTDRLVNSYFKTEERKNTVSIYGQEIDLESYDQNAKPIWEIAEELTADVPDEELDKIPSDLSINYKHYLYGSLKRD